MSLNQAPPPDTKPIVSDTERTTPGKLLLFVVPLAVVALVVLLVGMHFLGGTK